MSKNSGQLINEVLFRCPGYVAGKGFKQAFIHLINDELGGFIEADDLLTISPLAYKIDHENGELSIIVHLNKHLTHDKIEQINHSYFNVLDGTSPWRFNIYGYNPNAVDGKTLVSMLDYSSY